MIWVLWGVLSWVGCVQSPDPPQGGNSPTTSTLPDTSDTDSPTEPEPVVTEETVPDHELEDGWIFSLETIHEIEIDVDFGGDSVLAVEPGEKLTTTWGKMKVR